MAAGVSSASSVRLQTVVQHHPSRADLLPSLLAALPAGAQVVTDPDPDAKSDPWRTYRECLRALSPDASHLLVVQDDALPCEHFAEAVLAALEECPCHPVAWFVGGAPADACHAIRRAARAGQRWVQIRPWTLWPVVAASYPRAVVEQLLAWADDPRAPISRSDDGTVARFLLSRRITVMASVPSLVQHPDVVVSTRGKAGMAGADRNRVACVFVSEWDARLIKW